MLWKKAALALLLWGLSLGCGTESPPEAVPEAPVDPLSGLAPGSDAWVLAHAPLFVDGSREERHRALEASLTSHENGYATTRLGSYGLPRGGWDNLPEWNPRVRPLDRAMLDALARGQAPTLGEDASRLPSAPLDARWESWRSLGERVFFELPLRGEPALAMALADASSRAALGIEVTPDGRVPGVVVFTNVEGRDEIGITCALCHSSTEGHSALEGHSATETGTLVAGRARRSLDFGRIRLAALERLGPVEERLRTRYLSWGPGRADVLEQISEVPIAIPDLWAMREVRHFTQDGAITHVSPISLAIRQETQFIQANHLSTRPPRALMFALVVYLYSLRPPERGRREGVSDPAVSELGARTFARECGRCHGGAGYTGDLVTVEEVGTHPELGMGTARGTGHYRPQPLIDVRDAAPYLHHGVVPTLADLLSRERLGEDYARGVGAPGPVPGHAYGLDLPDAERAALLAHLDTL